MSEDTAVTSVFRDLIKRLLNEHESLLSRYDELLFKHRLLLSDRDGNERCVAVPSIPKPRHPYETNDTNLLAHEPYSNSSTGRASFIAVASEVNNGDVVDEVALAEIASVISDYVVDAGPARTMCMQPSAVEQDFPVDSRDSGETESLFGLRTSAEQGTEKNRSCKMLHIEWALSPEEVQGTLAWRKPVDGQDLEEVSGSMAMIHRYRIPEPNTRTSGCQWLMIEPNCRRKLWWDLIGMACLCWDFFVIPMVVFNIDDTSLTITVRIAIACFWTSDTILSFFVGFYDRGRVELSPRKIWIRYLKSWFMADVALMMTDWAVIFLEVASASSDSYFDFLRIGRTWRIIRFVRLLRLLHVVKAAQMFEELQDLIRSEVLQTMVIIAKLLWGVAMINHILACTWYWIGSIGPAEANWVHNLSMRDSMDESPDAAYLYLSALHWSLTQFMPASMEVVPHNKWERLFAICTILLAVVVLSSFLSSITAAMTHLRTIKRKQTKEQVSIRRFSIDNDLSSELALQVHRFARMYQSKSPRVLLADLHFVKVLPESLRIRLHSEVYLPRLSKHPLFERWVHADLPGLVKVCHIAMGERSLLAGEELFNLGDSCSMMYFALTCNLRYYYYDHTCAGDAIVDVTGSEVEQKRISEMVLWTPWEHRGRLVATRPSFLVTLNSLKFRGVVKARRAFVEPAVRYARSYVSEIEKAFDGNHSSVLDVWDEPAMLETIAYEAFQTVDVSMTRPDQCKRISLFGKLMSSGITSLLPFRKDSY